MKRLLLATDLSARADRALDRSIELARRHKAHLTVLHVVDEDQPAALRQQIVDATVSELNTVLQSASIPRDCGVTVCVTIGRDYRTILETVEKDASDLIILGRHRNESVVTPLRGTTMERVLSGGNAPVLVVTERADGDYGNVMVGADLSDFSHTAVKAAFAIAPGAVFHFVHAVQLPFEGFLSGNDIRRDINRKREEALSRIIDEEMETLLRDRTRCGDMPGKLHQLLRDGEVISVLRSEAARIRPDLLVIGTHGRTGIARAVLGSVAENLLSHPPCDTLAVKAW